MKDCLQCAGLDLRFQATRFSKLQVDIVRKEYTNKGEEEEEKKINGLNRSVRWSEELSFRANHRNIMSGNTK